GVTGARVLDPSPAQPEFLTGLSPRGDSGSDRAVDRGDLDLGPAVRLLHGHRNGAVDIVAMALEVEMRGDADGHVKVPHGASALTRTAFARDPDRGAVLRAFGNLDPHGLGLGHAPQTVAGRAGLFSHAPRPVARRTGFFPADGQGRG